MCSEEGKDGSKRANIVRGRFRCLGGEVDIPMVIVSDEDILIFATRSFHGQLTSEVGSREKQYE